MSSAGTWSPAGCSRCSAASPPHPPRQPRPAPRTGKGPRHEHGPPARGHDPPGGHVMSGFMWVSQLVYVLAASCFVLGLHLMNNPASARRGNQFSTAGMVIAIATTLALIAHAGVITATGWTVMLVGALIGGGVGLYAARTVQ